MKSEAKKTNVRLIISIIMVSAIFALMFIGGWYYILKLSSDSNRYTTESTNYQQQVEALSNLKLSYAKASLKSAAVYEAVPKEKNISKFLANFEILAKDNGISVISAKVGDLKTKSKIGSDYSQTISKSEYYELPIAYEVSGNYINFTKLISDLSIQKRLITVNNLVVVTDPSDNVSAGTIRANFTIIIYLKK